MNGMMRIGGILATVVIILAVAAAYQDAFDGEFVYDDLPLILENPHVTGRDLDLGDLLAEPYFDAGSAARGYYRPLVTLLYRLEYGLSHGGARLFHATNLIVHILNGVMLLFLAVRFGASGAAAFALALLFAVHPMTTESIAWISGRTDPLALTGMLAALLFMGRFLDLGEGKARRRGGLSGPGVAPDGKDKTLDAGESSGDVGESSGDAGESSGDGGDSFREPRKPSGDPRKPLNLGADSGPALPVRARAADFTRPALLVAAWIAGTAALGAKEVAFLLPLLLAAAVRLGTHRDPGRSRKRTLILTAPLAVTVGAVLLLRMLLPESGDEVFHQAQGSLFERLWTFLAHVPRYLECVFSPGVHKLARPAPLFPSPFAREVLWGTLILGFGVLALVLAWRFRRTTAVLGALLFLGGLVSVSGLVPFPYGFREMEFPFFERYLYVPMAGIVLLVAGWWPRGALIPIAPVLVVAAGLGLATADRVPVWHDDERLFEDGVRAWPDSPTLWFGLGQALLERGKAREASSAFHRAVWLDRSFTMARVHEAVALAGIRDGSGVPEAVKLLEEVVRDAPEDGQAWEALGFIHAGRSDWDQALIGYSRAVRFLPRNDATRDSLDTCLRHIKGRIETLFLEGKDYDEVIRRADHVLKWVPGTAWAHEARGLSLLALGRKDEATSALERAVTLDAEHSLVAMDRLVGLYLEQGRREEARRLQERKARLLRGMAVAPGAGR